MTIVFEDNLIGSGALNGRISTSGHTWVAGVSAALSAKGVAAIGAGQSVTGDINGLTIPAGSITFEATILGSSIASSPALWVARFGGEDPASAAEFSIGLRHLSGTIHIVEYSDSTSFTSLYSFPRVAATVYDLRVEFDGVNYTVFLDDVAVYGPVAPVNSPIGFEPHLITVNSGSGETNAVYVQNVKITQAAPPAAFWTNRLKTAEVI